MNKACLVGSRELTLQDIGRADTVCELLNKLGITGYSGGAEGMDTVWADRVFCQVFLPYNGFNGHRETADASFLALENAPAILRRKAEKLAKDNHRAGDLLRGFSLLAHTRNAFQVMGVLFNKDTMVDITIYAAPETAWASVSGGTATAVNISRSMGIPTYNIRIDSQYEALIKLLESELEN